MKWSCFFERIWNDMPEEGPWPLCTSSGSAIHHPGPASLGRWPGAPALMGSQPGLADKTLWLTPRALERGLSPGQAMFLLHLHWLPLQLPKLIQGRTARRLRGRARDRTGICTQHLAAYGPQRTPSKQEEGPVGDRRQSSDLFFCGLVPSPMNDKRCLDEIPIPSPSQIMWFWGANKKWVISNLKNGTWDWTFVWFLHLPFLGKCSLNAEL